MTVELNHPSAPVFSAFSKYASLAVIAIGSLVLLGWLLDIAILKSVIPGFVSMKANTAIAFILAGFSLWSGRNGQPDRRAYLFQQVCALVVTLFGLLTLGEYIFHTDFGMDQWLFRELPTAADPSPGRMSMVGALNFILLGLALLFQDTQTRPGTYPAQWLALIVGSLAFLGLVGYLYDVKSFYSVGTYSSMALHTVLNFLLLSYAVLGAHPERGMVRIFSSDTVGGVLLRRFVPVVVLMPIVLGWLRLWGQRAGFYDTPFGVALLVVSMVALLTVTIWQNAGSLNNQELSRRRVERALRHSEERFAKIFHNIPVATSITRLADGRFVEANDSTFGLYGFTRDELIGHTSLELSIFSNIEQRAKIIQELKEHSSVHNLETTLSSKDGQLHHVLLSSELIDLDGEPHVLGLVYDISARKMAEERLRLQAEELVRSNKELEQFAYVASHDLQEPLRMVSSYVQLLARRYRGKLDGDADEFIGFAVEGANRMKVLINDLLAFSRVGTHGKQMAPVRLDEILDQVVSNLALNIEESGTTFSHDPLPQVVADDGQMLQLFQNLVGNALKFHGEAAPKVHVGVRREKDRWLIFVRDNGIGIDPEFAERIFIIFQRLHNRDEYQGTGIGLAIARKIVERHGGRIWVESKPGQGSTFYFTLAAADELAVPEAEAASADANKSPRRDTVADRADDLV